MREYNVAVMVDGQEVGNVVVNAASEVDNVQVAATAYDAVRNAVFVVNGEAFTTHDMEEWWA